jgi:hypothetical protein
MIDKIDYGDLYKFRTSVGLIIMALAVVLPWFIINQDKSHYLSIEEYNSLGNQSKWLADYQRTVNIIFAVIIPIVSAFGFWFGLKLFKTGYNQWKKKQDSADEYEQLNLISKRAEVKKMDSEEVDRKAEEEIIRDNFGKPEKEEEKKEEFTTTTQITTIQERKEKLLSVEAEIFKKITDYNTFNYNPLQNLKFSKYTFDIVLQAFYPNQRVDIIIEVKYLQSTLNMVNLRTSFLQFISSTSEYRRQTSRKAKMYFFIVYDSNVGSQEEIERFRQALIDLKTELTGSSDTFTILFLNDQDLESYDIRNIVE